MESEVGMPVLARSLTFPYHDLSMYYYLISWPFGVPWPWKSIRCSTYLPVCSWNDWPGSLLDLQLSCYCITCLTCFQYITFAYLALCHLGDLAEISWGCQWPHFENMDGPTLCTTLFFCEVFRSLLLSKPGMLLRGYLCALLLMDAVLFNMIIGRGCQCEEDCCSTRGKSRSR